MDVKPFLCAAGYLYVPVKRGDQPIAPNKPEQLRLRDGMFGGYIDPTDWTTPPTISKFNQGEVLWIRVPKTDQNKAALVAAGMPLNQPKEGEAPSKDYRRMAKFIDFNSLTPHYPEFMPDVYSHKKPVPLMMLDNLPSDAIKDASQLKLTDPLKPDVGQITSGNYTIGPAGANYPTFGGAGGGYAALGNLTNNLTFTLIGNITETASATITEALGGFTLMNTSNNPHYGDPTAGWLIQVNFNGARMFDLSEEGPGTFEIEHLFLRWVAAHNAANEILFPNVIAAAHQINLHDLLLDGNAKLAETGLNVADNTPTVHFYNVVGWDFNGYLGNISSGNANNLYENTAGYDTNNRIWRINGQPGTWRNNTAYGGAFFNWNGQGAATGRHNVSDDASCGDATWLAGLNNEINHLLANDVLGANDLVANFFDIIAGGPLDGAGEANAIAARTACIRNRPVPYAPTGLTSRGPAELTPPPDSAVVGRPAIGIGIGIGIGI